MTLNVQPRAGGSFKFFDGSGDYSFAMPAPKVAPPMVDEAVTSFRRTSRASSVASGQLGISVDELSPQLAEYFGTKEGVLVTTVRETRTPARLA